MEQVEGGLPCECDPDASGRLPSAEFVEQFLMKLHKKAKLNKDDRREVKERRAREGDVMELVSISLSIQMTEVERIRLVLALIKFAWDWIPDTD